MVNNLFGMNKYHGIDSHIYEGLSKFVNTIWNEEYIELL